MTVSLADKVRATNKALLQEIRGEIMFLHTTSETYFGLNEVGSHMYRVLISAESIQSALSVLNQHYAVDPDELQRDLLHLTGELLNHGLIAIDAA